MSASTPCKDLANRAKPGEIKRAGHIEDYLPSSSDLFNAIRQPTFILDTRHTILAANEAASELTGQPVNRLVGKKCFQILHGGGRAPVECPLGKVLQTNKAHVADMAVEAFDRYLLVSCSPIFGESGSVEGIIHIAQDITERKTIEKALRESEERFRLIADYTHGLEFWRDVDGLLLWVNPAVERLTGYSVEECRAMSDFPLEIVHPEDFQSVRELFGGMQVGKEGGKGYQFRIVHKNGSIRWMALSWQPVFDSSGGHRGFRLSAGDVSDQKKTLEDLRKSEQMYRELFEKGSDLLCFHDLEGNLLETNLEFKKEYGWSKEELTQKNIRDLIPERYKADFSDYLRRIKSSGHDEGILAMVAKEGRELIVEYRNVLVHDTKGTPIGVKGSARDITEKIRMHRERKKLEEQIRRVQKMEAIGTLAGGIAHEFNNILGIILGNAELAMDDSASHSSLSANLGQIREATMRARDIVRQLLNFSRRSEQRRRPLTVVPIVKEAALFMSNSIPATIRIQEDISRSTHTILGEPSQVQQLLVNLLTNAAEAMHEKGGTLTVRLNNEVLGRTRERGLQKLVPGNYVRLEVSDTGQGIAPDSVEKIFDPYFTTKGMGLGRGMGLTVAHSIVRDHDGAIHIDTEKGRGTTVSVLFPAAPEGLQTQSGDAETLPGGNEEILVVDDEEQLARLTKIILERLGYGVEMRTDPVEALDLITADPHKFDLVVTDLTMPHMAGSDLAARILDVNPEMAIVLCTGYTDRMDESKLRGLGVRACLEKPLDRRKLAIAVRQLLDDGKEG